MSKTRDRAQTFTKENVENAINDSHSFSSVIKKLHLTDLSYSSASRVVRQALKIFNLSFDTYDPQLDRNVKQRKYQTIKKFCPICKQEFETQEGHSREKTTCSHACSNTFFRSGLANGNWGGERYQTICFAYHKYECVICQENLIVSVHHYNHDHEDNRPENLVPMCQTHHQYWHSRHQHLIKDKVDEYVKSFMMTKCK